jgi:motility quorum-sensing regulator / GCU-specific mRNA interferase toxin
VEKWVPHYALADIQAAVASRGASAFTKSALDGGRELGLTVPEMLDAIATLGRREFYKSMTTYVDHTVWQDVYHAKTDMGLAYVKFTLCDGRIVISFKRL